MKLISEPLSGLKLIEPHIHRDHRGDFVKTYHEDLMGELGIALSLAEEFFSTSGKNVLRGMHFQAPPHAHNKLIYCLTGSCLDVALDLRKNSETFGQSVGFELSEKNRYLVFIPVGFAHGFHSREDNTCLVYKTDHIYDADLDRGVRWDSFGFEWGCSSPIVSDRDDSLMKLNELETLFSS